MYVFEISPGSCSEGVTGGTSRSRGAGELGCPLGVVEVAQPRAEMAGGRRWQGAGRWKHDSRYMWRKHPQSLLAWDVGAQKGQRSR